MINLDLNYGLSKLSIELPNSAIVVRYGKTYQDPPKIDPVKATQLALKKPLGNGFKGTLSSFSSLFSISIRESSIVLITIINFKYYPDF